MTTTTKATPPGTHCVHDNHASTGAGWVELRVMAEQYWDLQKTRIALINRATRGGIDPAVIADTIDAAAAAEHLAALAMRRTYRRVVPPPIITWQKDTAGIGEHLLARLLGVIGHPIHTTRYAWAGTGTNRQLYVVGNFDRRVSDLWSYCGHGDPTRKRRKGMTAEEAFAMGAPAAKMLVRLIAEGCMKCRTSPYRDVYDQARDKYAERTHTTECPQCKGSSQPGDPWRDGHQHVAALRLVGKHILKDLWEVAHDD